LHPRIIAPNQWNCDRTDDAEEAGSIALGTAPRAAGQDFWGRPLGRLRRPERPFLSVQSPARASVNAKRYPAVFRVIRKIAVPTDPGAVMPECKAVSGSFAVPIRPIVVPTDPGAMISNALQDCRRPLTDAYAHRAQRITPARALQVVRGREQQAGAGHPERVA